MPSKIKLDHPGIASILVSSEVSAVVGESARSVGAHITARTRSGPVPVKVDYVGITGKKAPRVTWAVTMAHAAGLGIEAKHGSLARAAAGAGLEVKSAGSS